MTKRLRCSFPELPQHTPFRVHSWDGIFFGKIDSESVAHIRNMWHIPNMRFAFYSSSQFVENLSRDLKIAAVIGYAVVWSIIFHIAS